MCLTNANMLCETASAWGCGCVRAVQTVPHLTALFPAPLGSVLNQQWPFFPPVTIQMLPSLLHPLHISIPFTVRATSFQSFQFPFLMVLHSFVGSLALLHSYFSLSGIFSFTSHPRLQFVRVDKLRSFWFLFRFSLSLIALLCSCSRWNSSFLIWDTVFPMSSHEHMVSRQ